MLKAINKIPAGTFLVPMILAMLMNTFMPEFMPSIGGVSGAFFNGSGTGFITGALTFASGTTLKLDTIGDLIKHQGSLLLVKSVIATVLSILFLMFFGDDGILGISAIGFIAIIYSVNPSVQVSVLNSYGYERDGAILALSGIFCLPVVPLLVYSVYSSGGFSGVDYSPVWSASFPLVLGAILGNIDDGFTKLFAPMIGALMPLLGWNLGIGMNFIESLKSGISGIMITVFFIVLFSAVLYFVDKSLKFEGISAMSYVSVASLSMVAVQSVAQSFPHLEQYVNAASGQILFATIITALTSPLTAQYLYKKNGGSELEKREAAVK